jgi:hypothetical protein
MKHLVFSVVAAALLHSAVLPATLGQAQPARVFVAAQGSDGNPCTFAMPCRSFQHAHDTVAAGGEIDVLDPAGYGIVTITKSISIQGHGFAGNLRGLLLDGVGSGSTGIGFNTGASLNVQDCLIRNSGTGINFRPVMGGSLFVADTLVADNISGIEFSTPGSAPVSGALDHVRIENHSSNGLTVRGTLGTGPIAVTVSDSVIANQGTGVGVSAGLGTAVVMVRSSTIANSATGIGVNHAGATARVARSTITGNNLGWTAVDGATLSSYGDNNVDGNTTDGTPTNTITTK